jgi:hypothetical protein
VCRGVRVPDILTTRRSREFRWPYRPSRMRMTRTTAGRLRSPCRTPQPRAPAPGSLVDGDVTALTIQPPQHLECTSPGQGMRASA